MDGFAFPSSKCSSYFLTHQHSDHTWGLRPSFSAGTIYCSEITAALVIGKMNIKPQFVHPLPLNQPTLIEGVEVTLLDANHCPGAVMFLFHLPRENKTILHTGDFRASQQLIASTLKWLEKRERKVHTVYLDTTYLNERYTFPDQADVLASIGRIAKKEVPDVHPLLFHLLIHPPTHPLPLYKTKNR